MTDLYEDGLRQFRICNACRYCEGYCAVWDAIERKDSALVTDLKYYSNLCHDCRECYYVCPYTEPHEFAVNIPKLLSTVRIKTYEESARPGIFSSFLKRPVIAWSGVALFSLLFTFLFIGYINGFSALFSDSIALSQIIPDTYFKAMSILLYSYIAVMWLVESFTYWGTIREKSLKIRFSDFAGALYDAFSHKYFKGGGAGCNYPNEKQKSLRVLFHPLLVGGFLVDLAMILFYPDMTFMVNAAYVAGAVAMTVGSAGLLAMKPASKQELTNSEMKGNDYPFTTLMLLTGITGIIFPLVPFTVLFVPFFALHVAFVATIFLMAPFSKFIHPVFRLVALTRNRAEARVEAQAAS